MNALQQSSRLARAIGDLNAREGSTMPFGVMPHIAGGNMLIAAKDVARGIGYTVVDVPLPLHPATDVAEVGRLVSDQLARATGPALLLVHAGAYDGCQTHRGIVEGAASLAAESWSIDGRTALLVIACEDPADVAHLVGDALGRRDWAACIPM